MAVTNDHKTQRCRVIRRSLHDLSGTSFFREAVRRGAAEEGGRRVCRGRREELNLVASASFWPNSLRLFPWQPYLLADDNRPIPVTFLM